MCLDTIQHQYVCLTLGQYRVLYIVLAALPSCLHFLNVNVLFSFSLSAVCHVRLGNRVFVPLRSGRLLAVATSHEGEHGRNAALPADCSSTPVVLSCNLALGIWLGDLFVKLASLDENVNLVNGCTIVDFSSVHTCCWIIIWICTSDAYSDSLNICLCVCLFDSRWHGRAGSITSPSSLRC